MDSIYSPSNKQRTITIEVFKTNVGDEADASYALERLQETFPAAKVNFDLEDCDKILRFQTDFPPIDVEGIISCLARCNVSAEILE